MACQSATHFEGPLNLQAGSILSVLSNTDMAELLAQQAEREASYEELDCFKQSSFRARPLVSSVSVPFVDAPDQKVASRMGKQS